MCGRVFFMRVADGNDVTTMPLFSVTMMMTVIVRMGPPESIPVIVFMIIISRVLMYVFVTKLFVHVVCASAIRIGTTKI